MFTDEIPETDGGASAFANETLVAVEGVTRRYARRVALEHLSFAVRAGEVFGLVGANGGGKTTTLRILAGILKPDRGRGQVLGFDLVSEAIEIRERVGYMSQRFSLYGDLSVLENLRFRASIYGLKRPREAAEIAIEGFELSEYARSPAGQLSGGWGRRLQLAAALIHSPKLVLLDEPTAGLDALSRQQVWRHIGRLAADGVGVVVSTHDLSEAERCSHAALLAEGRVVAAGTPDQIARSVPAVAFLMSGATARLMTQSVEAIPGVIATYPQGPSLRVVAAVSAEEDLLRVASVHQGGVARVAMRLEDAVLAFTGRS
jgi:ABC-2 type transport system ATP-binding protein